MLIMAIFIASCGEKDEALSKLKQLENLKKQHSEISAKIKQLEAEIKAEGKSDENAKARTVKVTPVNTLTFTHYLDIQGKIDAEENITISAKMPAPVSKIYVKAGKQVKSGELLAELDNATILAGIEEVKTGMQLVNTLYEKQKSLWEQKIGTEVQYLQAKAQKEQMDKRLASLYEQLEMSKIQSPIAGTVDEVMLRIGQTAAPGVPAIRIVNLNSIKAKAEVAESYAGRIKEGNMVNISIPDLNKEITAKVTYTAKVINPLNRTFTVEAMLDKNQDLHPNMMAIMRIADYKNEAAMVVPINTIQNSEEGQYLMLAVTRAGKTVAERRTVQTGLSYNGIIEVVSGLSANDRVITTGYQDLNPGDALSIQ